MQKPHHHSRHHQTKPAFWYDLGRLLFPDLIHHPRAMQIRMIAITLTLGAILVGGMIGLIQRANDPMLIQAREGK